MQENNKLGVHLNIVKIAGFCYAMIIVLALVPNMMFSASAITLADNPIAAMAKTQHLYSAGMGIEFTMYIMVMVLSWSLYVILKPYHPQLALFGFAFRFGEAILGCIAIILYAMTLLLLSGSEFLNVFTSEQLGALGHFFLKVSGSTYDVLLTLMGIGAFALIYLFLVAKLVPNWLSIWGLITYFSMMCYGMINIFYPDAPAVLRFAMAPGALFELTFGFWLFFKGINVAKFE